jgi:ABC-type multidrug transport system ATPase subunit
MLSDGKVLRYGSPDEIKGEITKPILEIVSPEVRNATNFIREKTAFEVQMFGDRFDVVIDDYETDYPLIKKILDDNSISIIDNRLKPVSLENVFIKILKEKNK